VLKDTIVWNIEAGRKLSASQLARADKLRTALFQRMHQFMQRYDFIVLPVNQVPPFPVEQQYVTEIDGVAMESYIDWMRSCYYVTACAHPALSLPCGFTDDGLPVGMQIVGRHRGEFELLQIAHAFEQATGVGQRRPTGCCSNASDAGKLRRTIAAIVGQPSQEQYMAGQVEITNMALFCDFENVALGVRDAKYASFDIRRVLERLLLKGSIVVKKAYCDWDRYKEFKAPMHEASFELIEIPHVRQSGKNSADIRMVVDALDLCYTKSHVDAFVIISGDSDFSPLVSKLRENNKYVIGIGVKDSTSDLLSANCDEFIFYDDLVREQKPKRKPVEKKAPAKKAAPNDAAKAPQPKADDDKRQEALDFVVETIEALSAERGDEKMWGSMVKQTMKRRRPGFTESAYGYRSFKEMVEDAQRHHLLVMTRDEKTGQYTVRLPASGE
jgi:uncharacterized protein (TIGR00288 family)